MAGTNDFQLTEDFNLQEFECTHPEHRHVRVDKELVYKLQALRYWLGEPVIINSGYRCEERNRQVGGVKHSQHLFGRAVDFSLNNQDKTFKEIYKKAKEIGFTGIGFYRESNFIHLDIREGDFAHWKE